jgi:hypothetical protein
MTHLNQTAPIETLKVWHNPEDEIFFGNSLQARLERERLRRDKNLRKPSVAATPMFDQPRLTLAGEAKNQQN